MCVKWDKNNMEVSRQINRIGVKGCWLSTIKNIKQGVVYTLVMGRKLLLKLEWSEEATLERGPWT